MKIQMVAMMALLFLAQSCGGSGSGSNSQSGNTTAPNSDSLGTGRPLSDEAPINAAFEDEVIPAEGMVPTPEPEPEPIILNDIELAILDVRNGAKLFPNTRERLDFKDQSPGIPVPDTDEPLDNDPFKNTLRRISSTEKFVIGGNTPTHEYSKRQAWNSNETLISIGDKILRTSDYKILVEQIPISTARNWMHSKPDTMVGFRFIDNILNEFGYYNVAKDQFTLIKRLDNFERCTIGNGEGSLSNDDRYIVFSCTDDADRTKLISYDIETQTTLGELNARPDMNWAGFSQSGKFIVVGNSGSTEETRNIIKYQPDFSEPDMLSRRAHHGDLGIDRYGDDVIVMIGANKFSYIRLKDKLKVTYPITDSSNPTGFGHVSCRNTKRPGWCYVSTYNQLRLAAIRLDYNGNSTLSADEDGEYSFEGVSVVEPWGVHRSTSGNYDKQPRASASPTGNHIVFSSDWYGATGPNAYVISAPDLAQ